MPGKKFHIYDESVCQFYRQVLNTDIKGTEGTRVLEGGQTLAVALHSELVLISGTVQECANQRITVALKVKPDAVKNSTHGYCWCKVEFRHAHTHTPLWTWRRCLAYELEDVDDLLNQFFKYEELAKLLLRYGITLQM
jgi:hypothetical protein